MLNPQPGLITILNSSMNHLYRARQKNSLCNMKPEPRARLHGYGILRNKTRHREECKSSSSARYRRAFDSRLQGQSHAHTDERRARHRIRYREHRPRTQQMIIRFRMTVRKTHGHPFLPLLSLFSARKIIFDISPQLCYTV